MKFAQLAVYFDKLENTSSRLAITDILSDLYKKADPGEIDKIVYLSLGTLAPSFESIVFNLAEKMALQVLSLSYSVDLEEIKKDYKKFGDIGLVAEQYSKNKTSNMTINQIYEELVRIAKYEGEGSVDIKINKLSGLISKMDALSARFLIRIPVGKLRLGFSDKTVIDALTLMNGDKELKKKIAKAYEVLPDVGRIAKLIKTNGTKKLVAKPEVGVPVMPMLAQRLKSPDEMIEKMGEVSVEPKFDGLRALIHYNKEKNILKIFTRNLNEVTEMFPEVQEIGKYINAKSAILDSEAIGVDPKTERIVDFQKTISRKRKHGLEEAAKDTPLRFQIFDVVSIDGKDFMDEPYLIRRKALEKLFVKNKIFTVDENTVTSDADVIRKMHKDYRGDGLEGVIVKKTDSKYIPGRVGWNWVKMKEVETAHARLADTIDCVIMGYTQGKGKRAEFGIGQFLAGVVSGDKVLSISKVGTGLSDEQFRDLKKRLAKLEVKEKPENYEVTKDLLPDFWVKPEVIVELAADEISVSPINKHTSGYALRFPRLIKFREDKSVNQATTLKEIVNLYKQQ